MIGGLPDFFRYNLWANLSLLDACSQLSDAQLDTTTTGTYGVVCERRSCTCSLPRNTMCGMLLE